MLCAICQLAFQGRTKRTYSTSSFTYNHHQSALDVQAAANQDCHFWTFILSQLSADEISRVLNYSTTQTWKTALRMRMFMSK
jgi:hypothetical protein